MVQSFFASSSPSLKFVFTLFVIAISFLFVLVVGFVLAIPIFDIDLMQTSEIFSNFNHAENIRILKYFQVIQSIGLFVIPSLIVAWLFGTSPREYLQFRRSDGGFGLIAVLCMITLLPVVNFFAMLNQSIELPDFLSELEIWLKDTEESAMVLTEQFLRVKSFGGLMFNIFMIAVIPAVGEELLFRGVFQRIFTEWSRNVHIGVLLSALIFSAIHMQFYGFIPRFLLGAFFGYLLVWSRSIWVPILAHFINNSIAVVLSYLILQGSISSDLETTGATAGTIVYAVSGMLISGLLIYLLFRKRKSIL